MKNSTCYGWYAFATFILTGIVLSAIHQTDWYGFIKGIIELIFLAIGIFVFFEFVSISDSEKKKEKRIEELRKEAEHWKGTIFEDKYKEKLINYEKEYK
jgi:large-conductance mechanosensitive channel